jgi:NhaP-type Na+/H+ or K+/H+ antiporter
MLFVLFGVLVCDHLIGVFPVDLESPAIHLVAERTLILILFTDASRISLPDLLKDHAIPVRLLAIGLPLTILLEAVVAAVVFDVLTFWEGAVLGAILAPTDAALGQAVVSSPRVPQPIRGALNVESGLNDGIALPVVLLTLSLAAAGDHNESTSYWLNFFISQVVLGPVAGVMTGFVGARLVQWGVHTGSMSHSCLQLSALAISLLAYAGAELLGGNGFIAAFCAGLTVGNTAREICDCLYEFAEAEGQLFTLLTFMIFGALMVPTAIMHLNLEVVLYSLLSLTVLRMVPAALSLAGLKLRAPTVTFLAWFGPRGIASIIFGLVVLEEADLAHEEQIFNTMTFTVLLSVFSHGLTAVPAAILYGRKAGRSDPQ